MPRPYKAKSLAGAQREVRNLRRQRKDMLALLKQYAEERRLMARLAAKGPTFFSPIEVWAAEKVRDEILLRECRLKPDGTFVG